MRLDEFDNMDEGAQPAKKPNAKEVYRSLDQQERSANLRDYDRPKNTKNRLKTQPMAGPRGPIPESEIDEATSSSKPKKTHQDGEVTKTDTGLVHKVKAGPTTNQWDKKEKARKPYSSFNSSSKDDNTNSVGSTKKTKTGTIHKADNNYTGKGRDTDLEADYKKHFKEATGDEKFDNMMGKISGNTEPQNFNQAQNDRVQNKAENPDAETINALNKMMYDMHVTMQTANRLMQKLTRGR